MPFTSPACGCGRQSIRCRFWPSAWAAGRHSYCRAWRWRSRMGNRSCSITSAASVYSISASFLRYSVICFSIAASSSSAPIAPRHSFIWSRFSDRCWRSRCWASDCSCFTPSAICWCSPALRWRRGDKIFVEPQRLDLLNVLDLPHLREHLGRDAAVDLDQRDGVAALRLTAKMEGRNIDAGFAKHGGKAPDESRLVLVGHIQHRRRELGVHADALDIDDAGAAIG